jgi:hypothetical protein
METADIPVAQESSHVEITNEDNVHHFLQHQRKCSLLISKSQTANQAVT